VGTFTVLGVAEWGALASTFELGAVRSARPIAAGTINSNYELVTEHGRWFARVNEGKAEVDVAWEARLIGALAERGVATPAPRVASDGRPYAPVGAPIAKWVSVFPWREGHHLDPASVTGERARHFGAQLARLHVAGLDLPAAWRRGSIYDLDHLETRYARFAKLSDPMLLRAVFVLGEELERARSATDIRRRATHGMIHGDLFRDNVLWDGDQVVAILDFEQASGGSLTYDLAVCINDWCCPAVGVPDIALASALIDGYRGVRPLTAGDLEALPAELRLAAARFTITRVTDVYLARVNKPDKDFRAFLALSEAWRGESLHQLTATL
jgi:homoserine kinase type II